MTPNNLSIRDAFLLKVHELMSQDSEIIILTIDMGAPLLDPILEAFPDRVINVGIAEQNAINVAAGLAIEGYKVCVYGIASFIFSRAFEQIKVSLTMNANFYKHMNVTLLGVGAGLSYELSGPPHHAVEDVSVLNMIPGIEIFYPFSPQSSYELCQEIVEKPGIKYVRLDSGKLQSIPTDSINLKSQSFHAYIRSKKAAILASGPLIESINNILETEKLDFSLFSFFKLNNHIPSEIESVFGAYQTIVFAEECYQSKGVLQIEIAGILQQAKKHCNVRSIALNNKYFFMTGSRSYLHQYGGIGIEQLTKTLKELI